MAFLNAKLNVKETLKKLALVGAGSFLLFTPSARAHELTQSRSNIYDYYGNPVNATQYQPGSVRPIEVAYRRNFCPRNTYLFRYAETRNYNVSICATEGGTLYYVGQSKNRHQGGIVLRIRNYNRHRFVAFNGNTRYTVTPSRLEVTQNRRTIVSERVFQWEEGRGLRD